MQVEGHTGLMENAPDPGGTAFGRSSWEAAYQHLSAAAHHAPLGHDDLERLAVTAYLTGRYTESTGIWERAHHQALTSGDVVRAVRCAAWLAFGLMNRGESASGGNWVTHAQRLLDDAGADCVERGFLRYLTAVRLSAEGDDDSAHRGFVEAGATGDRFDDPELVALARVRVARCLINRGRIPEGVALLDESIFAIAAQQLSPVAVGDIYCTAIDGGAELFDLRRVQEWTAAFGHWCENQPELLLYRGQYLIHRAEMLLLHGRWAEAAHEAERAFDRLFSHPSVGEALYLRAELHRLRGGSAAAEVAYRQANRQGRQPHPGLALLRLAQGEVEVAGAAVRRALAETTGLPARAALLAGYVEIVLAGGDALAGRAGADELAALATRWDTDFLRAAADHATGAVLLADGSPEQALHSLRRAVAGWRDLGVPYERARSLVLIGRACHRLGDPEAAEMQFATAHAIFAELRAATDLIRLEATATSARQGAARGLSPRELEVLALVATGATNRAIAADLVISEETVASHVDNIFTKLGLSSRAAATAFAYQHDLI